LPIRRKPIDLFVTSRAASDAAVSNNSRPMDDFSNEQEDAFINARSCRFIDWVDVMTVPP
jgi:hypothetical protein